MAKELSFELDTSGRAKYPWDQWTNGKAWLLVRGEDFTCSIPSMRSAIHQYARRNNLTVVTTIPAPAEVARLRGERNPMTIAIESNLSPLQGLFVQFTPEGADSTPAKKPKRKLRRTSRTSTN
jgi:hypothetical protein